MARSSSTSLNGDPCQRLQRGQESGTWHRGSVRHHAVRPAGGGWDQVDAAAPGSPCLPIDRLLGWPAALLTLPCSLTLAEGHRRAHGLLWGRLRGVSSRMADSAPMEVRRGGGSRGASAAQGAPRVVAHSEQQGSRSAARLVLRTRQRALPRRAARRCRPRAPTVPPCKP